MYLVSKLAFTFIWPTVEVKSMDLWMTLNWTMSLENPRSTPLVLPSSFRTIPGWTGGWSSGWRDVNWRRRSARSVSPQLER